MPGEAELFDTKWFDYRDMHPLMATCLFTEAYKRAYSQIMLSHGREHFETAPFSTGLKRLPYQELSAVNKTLSGKLASLQIGIAVLMTILYQLFFLQLRAGSGTNYLALSISGNQN